VEKSDPVYLIIIAGGDDQSISRLTRMLHGQDVTKALAMVTRNGSLLQQMVGNFQDAVPVSRTFVLVPEGDQPRARQQLLGSPGLNILEVPHGGGCAVTVMQVLAKILLDKPDAAVIVASADFYLANPRPFVRTIFSSKDKLGMFPAIVMGASLKVPRVNGPWLLPGTRLGDGLFSFRKTIEPTSEEEARRLIVQGAMQNTSSFITSAAFLWETVSRELPEQARTMSQLWRNIRPSSQSMVRPVSGIRRHPGGDCLPMLFGRPNAIAIARVDGLGFSDWSCPETVLHSLPSPLERGWLLSRIASEVPPYPMPLREVKAAVAKG
jgi:mannose-1-phosphate guanylyltransferase